MAGLPVTITITQTFTAEIEPEWFDDVLPDGATHDDLWAAVEAWTQEHPAQVRDWADAPAAELIVVARDGTGQVFTRELDGPR